MRSLQTISPKRKEYSIYAVKKACDEDKWPEGTYRNAMREYHTVVIDAGVGQSR